MDAPNSNAVEVGVNNLILHPQFSAPEAVGTSLSSASPDRSAIRGTSAPCVCRQPPWSSQQEPAAMSPDGAGRSLMLLQNFLERKKKIIQSLIIAINAIHPQLKEVLQQHRVEEYYKSPWSCAFWEKRSLPKLEDRWVQPGPAASKASPNQGFKLQEANLHIPGAFWEKRSLPKLEDRWVQPGPAASKASPNQGFKLQEANLHISGAFWEKRSLPKLEDRWVQPGPAASKASPNQGIQASGG
ncbi:unnamed protein product, partial [Ranitomeya imitator]